MDTKNISEKEFLNQFSSLDKTGHGVELPEIEIDQKYVKQYNLPKGFINFDFLKSLCDNRLREYILNKSESKKKEYQDRLDYELDLIEELSFTDYFLLIWDVCNFCREKGILLGHGRGSACGSLILFLINVTKIDPIRYELYFERFVSRARAKKTVVDGVTYLDGSLMCDVDIDIDYYRRPEVIEYVSNKYKGRVCHILNVNTLTSKILIKECGKIVAAKSDQEMTKISSFIESKFGTVDSLEETRKKSPKFDNWCKENKRAFQVAQKLNGLPRNKGVHASGIIVSKHNLDETLPVELTKDGNLVSSYSKNTVELLTIKLDLLGVKTLSVVDEVCKIVGLNIDEINIEDPYIYQICQDLDSRYGLFQISEDTAYKTTRAIKPRNIEDLSAVLAIARPGALQFIEPYSKYTASGDPPSLHPVLDPHLKESGNMLIYQEQLMRIASRVFGLSLEDGENIRRGVGKKKKEIIEKFEPILKKAGEDKGYDPEVFEIYWKLLHDSASYSFNKCLDPDTLVETPYGNKRIGDLNIGDKVYSYDFEVDEVVESTVTQTYVSNKQAVEYEFESKDKVISSKSHKFMEKTSGRMIPIKSLDDFQCDFKLCLD
jgi:DNA polymerase III subunit alpha